MLILASASPRRTKLLEQLGIDFKVVPSNFIEQNSLGLPPIDYAIACAKGKAEEVYSRTGGTVLAADTIVVAGGKILEKPKGNIEAKQMLDLVCGSEHEVITAVCLIKKGSATTAFERTKLFINKLSNSQLNSYIESGSPLDKAGAYGIQDEIIKQNQKYIRGSLDNVIGLPTNLVSKLLQLKTEKKK